MHLYADSDADLVVGRTAVRIVQHTTYPWDGEVEIGVGLPQPASFALLLRVPGWCATPSITVNGKDLDLKSMTVNGYVRIEREWRDGDHIALSLPMAVQRIYAHPNVRFDRGRVAFRRGPVLFCAEGVDHDVPLDRLSVSPDVEIQARFDPDVLGGTVVLSAKAKAESSAGWDGVLYRQQPPERDAAPFTAVPYFAWDNREPGEMQVWMREF